MTPQEAADKMARAYRVMFDEDPDEFGQVMIDLAKDRVARGDFYSWEVTPGKVRRLTFSKESAQGEIVPIETPVADLLEEEVENEVAVRLPQITVEARRLNKKQQDFAVMIAQGLPIARAYALAGYGTTNTASAQAAGSRLANRDYMARYIRSLKEATWLKDTLTLAEKRHFLAQVVRTPVGEVDENHVLAQEVKRKTTTSKDGASFTEEQIKMPGKLEAIKLDAQLAGELNEQQQVNVGFNFAMLASDPEEMVVETPAIEQ